MIDQFIASDF